jgi:5,10-methylenetetrahydromethanopterin reductase
MTANRRSPSETPSPGGSGGLRRGLGFLLLGDLDTRRAVELTEYADVLGIPSVWITDEPFFRGAMPTAGACAQVTTRIRIGIGIVNPYDHPPAWMAMEIAALNELAKGRAILGIGASWEPPIAKQGIPFTLPLSAVRDTVAIVRSLLAGERCTYSGRKFTIDGVKLDFSPGFPQVPIYIASMFPVSLEQTGRIADGVILSVLCPAAYVRNATRLIRRGAEQAGRSLDGFDVVQYFPMCVLEDGEAARNIIKEKLAFYIVHSYGPDPEHWRRVADLGEFDLAMFAHLYERLAKGGDPRHVIPDEFVQTFAVAGTPRECLDILAEYKAAGLTEAVATIPDTVDSAEQLRLIAQHLVPAWESL